MAVTTTYSFNLPTVGGDTNAWGGLLNDNWSDIDDLLDGTTPVTGIDIDSGSVDGATIGAANPSSGVFTTLNATGALGADLLAAIVDHLHPVGSIIVNVDGTNPGTIFPGTTWVATAEGRAIVGVGTSDSTDALSWTAEQKRGNESHELTTAELASHTHDDGTLVTNTTGNHTHPTPSGTDGWMVWNQGGGVNLEAGSFPVGVNSVTTGAGDHSHTISGNTGSAGSGNSHNNLQPSMAFYVWERTV